MEKYSSYADIIDKNNKIEFDRFSMIKFLFIRILLHKYANYQIVIIPYLDACPESASHISPVMPACNASQN